MYQMPPRHGPPKVEMEWGTRVRLVVLGSRMGSINSLCVHAGLRVLFWVVHFFHLRALVRGTLLLVGVQNAFSAPPRSS